MSSIIANDVIRKLVTETRLGDQQSFKELYLIFAPKLYYFSRKYKLSDEECEGVVQDVFLKIWEKRKGLNPDLSFNAYVFLMAKNQILNGFKKQASERAYFNYLEKEDQATDQSEQEILGMDLQRIAIQAIESLPDKRKNIYKMSREKGLSNQEIAERLEISKSTVENQINKSLKYLKSYLEQKAEIKLKRRNQS